MFYKYDYRMLTILMNIHEHLKRDWDYLLVIVGDTGTGKSHFGLDLLDEWYSFILKKPITKELSVQMASDYKIWLNNFKNLSAYDMNIYDEGATTLDSKAYMTKLSRDLSKLFNVFRAKKFFSVIILPSFFDLNKYFREKRLRGLIWIDKRGHYKFYTKKGIEYLNAYNEKSIIKSMWKAKPFHQSTFPKYKGVLLKPYLATKNDTMNEVLEDVITNSVVEKKQTAAEFFEDKVKRLLEKGKTQKEVKAKLGIGNTTISKIRLKLLKENKLKI